MFGRHGSVVGGGGGGDGGSGGSGKTTGTVESQRVVTGRKAPEMRRRRDSLNCCGRPVSEQREQQHQS